MTHNGHTYYAFPTPASLLPDGIPGLRGIKLSNRKAEYILDVAASMVDGSLDLEGLRLLTDEEATKRLLALRGVGPWTAHWLLLRAPGKNGRLPRRRPRPPAHRIPPLLETAKNYRCVNWKNSPNAGPLGAPSTPPTYSPPPAAESSPKTSSTTNPNPSPSFVVLADAGTHLSSFRPRLPSLRHSRVEPALVKTGAGTHPLPLPSVVLADAGPILVPHPISRRGSPRGPPSLTFTPAPSPHPYPLSSRMRGPIPVPTRRACPRENGGGGPILIPHPTSRRGVPRGRPSLTFTPAPSPHPYPLSSRMRGPICRPSPLASLRFSREERPPVKTGAGIHAPPPPHAQRPRLDGQP